MMDTENLMNRTLSYGSHKSREEGMCLMEAVAFLAGEGHTDRPECACPVIARFGRFLNDCMGEGAEGDALRAKYLAPLAEKLIGTRSTPEVERRRGFYFSDRAVRLFAPLALASAGLRAEAERLRSLPEIVDKQSARAAARAARAEAAYADRAAASAAYADADAYADAAEAAARAARAAARAARDAYADRAALAASYAAGAAREAALAAEAGAADAAAAAARAADAASDAAWEQAAQVLAEACEITEGGE